MCCKAPFSRVFRCVNSELQQDRLHSTHPVCYRPPMDLVCDRAPMQRGAQQRKHCVALCAVHLITRQDVPLHLPCDEMCACKAPGGWGASAAVVLVGCSSFKSCCLRTRCLELSPPLRQVVECVQRHHLCHAAHAARCCALRCTRIGGLVLQRRPLYHGRQAL